MNSSKSSQEHRIIVIGLDAGDPNLIRLWSKAGTLPFVSSLIESGTWVRLISTGDFAGDTVWPSFSTGVSPAKHGVYHVRQLKRGTVEIVRTDQANCNYLPFWWLLRNSGKKVAIFDIPRIYPVDGIDGIQIASWGGHNRPLKGTCSLPLEIIKDLVSKFGKHPKADEVINTKGVRQERKLLDTMIAGVEKKLEATKFVMDQDKWDLFIAVFGETHSSGHQFLHRSEKSHWAYDEQFIKEIGRDPLCNVYSTVDSSLAELLKDTPENVTYFVVSCHGIVINYTGDRLLPEILTRLGFQVPAPGGGDRISEQKDYFSVHNKSLLGRIRSLFPGSARDVINEFLPLSIQERLFARLFAGSVDWKKTLAFTLPCEGDSSWISLNLKDREPYGTVEPGAGYDDLCKEIKEELVKLVNPATGKSAVREVIKTDEIFKGEFVRDLPDLIVYWAMSGPIKSLYHPKFGPVFGDSTRIRKAQHTGEGFLIAGGKYIERVKTIKRANVMDIAPTILYLMGQAVPKDMDGKVLLEIISDEFKKENTVKYENRPMITPKEMKF